MQLLVCDSCGRPLSEGALARGEAVERGAETICRACDLKARTAKPPAAADSGPLAHYAQTVWKCKSCGIPITALDLIEGRAARIGDEVECVRCRAAVPAPVSAPAAPVSARVPRRSAALPAAALPAGARPASKSAAYVAEAHKEERRPILPIVLIAIVLPMFALSLWYAISAQARLNESTAQAKNAPPEGERRPRPREMLEPERDAPANTPPTNTEQPKSTPEQPKPEVMPASALKDLAAIEDNLARDTIVKLESRDLAVVWEGLIEAGSRRLIATRPWVRALLGDSDARTRAFACTVCAMLSDTNALLTIEEMAESDKSQDVRDAAHRARARLVGKATRDLSDMKPDELEALRKQIEEEIKRQKAGGGK